jgi:hypothetical protein
MEMGSFTPRPLTVPTGEEGGQSTEPVRTLRSRGNLDPGFRPVEIPTGLPRQNAIKIGLTVECGDRTVFAWLGTSMRCLA